MSDDTGTTFPRVSKWVAPISALYKENRTELDALEEGPKRETRLSELNVIQQIRNACLSPVIQESFVESKKEGNPYIDVHACMFRMEAGIIEKLTLPYKAWKSEGLLPEDYPETSQT